MAFLLSKIYQHTTKPGLLADSSLQHRCDKEYTPALIILPFSFCLPFDKRDDEEREKRKNKKKLPKIFGRYALKFLPLHPLSEKNSNRETSDL